MSAVEVLKLVGQGGFPVLFALLLIGLGWMTVKLGPQMFGTWSGMIAAISDLKTAVVAALGEQNTRIAALTAKLDSVQSTLEAMRQQDVATAIATAASAAAHTDDGERLPKPGGYVITDRDRDRGRR